MFWRQDVLVKSLEMKVQCCDVNNDSQNGGNSALQRRNRDIFERIGVPTGYGQEEMGPKMFVQRVSIMLQCSTDDPQQHPDLQLRGT
jgi:hypothetical protein